LPKPPGQGLTSTAFDRSTPVGFYGVCGYRICGTRVVRIDMLERLADLIRDRVFWKPRFPEEPRPAGSIDGGGFTIVPDMMSLVGCSGEEFQGILKSLNFRVQKKSVTREVVQTAAAPVAETTEAPTSEASETTAAEAPAPELPAEETPAVEAAPESAGAEPPAPVAETVEIDIWWPKDTGPFRHKAKPKEAKPRPRRPEREKPEPKPKVKFERPRRPEKPVDPNSPFAVLGQLKSQMAGQKR
jgi:ATP-dependent RNA helicase SUPV3L1/SUV3